MRAELVQAHGEAAAVAARLRAAVPGPESVAATVSEIVARVRAEGDAAVIEYTRRLDTGGADPRPLPVAAAELTRAMHALDPDVRAGLERAIGNVRCVAEAVIGSEKTVELGGHEVVLREAPVARAAVYVPGGRAPYPSTVVMGVVTAVVAGVGEIAVCTPPGQDGEAHPTILGACALAGASTVYRMGGAQAVAALAWGTESVQAVDVIVGPGNLYVQEAKRQLCAQVGIDGFAGPSDLVVVADRGVDPELIALDLLAQAEHGPGTLVVAVSADRELLERVRQLIERAPDTGAVARLVKVAEDREALAVLQAIAPEHVELIGPVAELLAAEVTRAGCVFLGPLSATAFGDYIAGSNHVLPTGGAARFASALSPATFRRRFCEVRVRDADALARAAAPIARAEGFELHARSMEARIRDND